MFDICVIGHISIDKLVTPKLIKITPGGTALYFLKVLVYSNLKFKVLTSLSKEDYYIIDKLKADGIDIDATISPFTTEFENIYNNNFDNRQQVVHNTSRPFEVKNLLNINAKIFHLGPLLEGDIPLDVIKYLSTKGMISLDVQGYTRRVVNGKIIQADWKDKNIAFPYINFLKTSEIELKTISQKKNLKDGAKYLADFGISEIVVTLGSKGSIILHSDTFYEIPVVNPIAIVDTTGCGDTYMASYLWKRCQGAQIEVAGTFGAVLAALKIRSIGPINTSQEEIYELNKEYTK